MASGFFLGILMANNGKWYLSAALAGVIFLNIHEFILCEKRQGRVRMPRLIVQILCVMIFFFLGNSRFLEQQQVQSACAERLDDGRQIEAAGTLSSKEYKNRQYVYYLDHCYLTDGEEVFPCSPFLFYQNTDTYSIGQTLIVTGSVKLWDRASNEGMFDAQRYYQSKKILFRLKDVQVKNAYGNPDTISERLYVLRTKIRSVYASYLTEEEAGVLSTIALGDKSLLDEEMKELYQKAGISHILAISGLHISVIGMGLYRILRKGRLSFGMAGAVCMVVLFGYGILSGFGTSTKRAVFMFVLMLLGQWAGRSYDTLSALSLSLIVILWENPYLYTYEGFVLSFAAVAGIVLVGQTVIKIRKPYFSWTENFLISLSIQLATIPAAAFFFHEVPMWSMLLNFFVLPVIGTLLFLALLGGVLGLFVVFPTKIIFLPCHWILLFYEKMCKITAGLPGATVITGQPEPKKLLLYYGMLAVCLVLMKKRKSRRGFLLTAACLFLFILNNPVHGFELDVLDVGQGDAVFLHSRKGVSMFFDGGSTDVKNVGEYRILPFLKAKGVRKIDYWIVSHTDEDHISGLREVLAVGYPVGTVVFSEYIVRDDAYDQLTALAKDYGSQIVYLKQGDVITDASMRLECVFPDASGRKTDKNAQSLVVRYEENGFSGLFTGDISSMEERYLLSQDLAEPVDYYKAAHHGSKYSNSEEFLAMLAPQVTTISCGKDNSYGHPGEEAVAHIKKSGSTLYETMESGRIRLRIQEGKIIADEYFKK